MKCMFNGFGGGVRVQGKKSAWQAVAAFRADDKVRGEVEGTRLEVNDHLVMTWRQSATETLSHPVGAPPLKKYCIGIPAVGISKHHIVGKKTRRTPNRCHMDGKDLRAFRLRCR